MPQGYCVEVRDWEAGKLYSLHKGSGDIQDLGSYEGSPTKNVDAQIFEHLDSKIDHMNREKQFLVYVVHSDRKGNLTKLREVVVNNQQGQAEYAYLINVANENEEMLTGTLSR